MGNMLSAIRNYQEHAGYRALRWIFWVGATLLLILLPSAVSAGTIKLAWDPVGDPDLSGYKVYYGTTPGVYTDSTPTASQTSVDLTNLQDCKVYYLAVKAVDANGNESNGFSNEISGMSAPVPSTVSPGSAKQATNFQQVTIYGTNFDTQARPDFGPDILVNSYSTSSCGQMIANITITEGAKVNSAPALPRLLTIINNGGPRGSKSGPFTVTFNERRADIDSSGQVRGKDLLYLQNAFGSTAGSSNYNIDADLNGDGKVDGADVSLLAIWHGHIFF
jgi:dockerin type I repeat protein/fibronectin type III domain protein